jgi:DNA-binding IclR family transcriptional regulator
MAAIKAVGVARHARPHLIELHRHTGLPVALAMLAGGELLLVDRPAGDKEAVEMAIELDRRLPPHATALGKVLLAYLPEQREHELVEALELHPHTSRTIVGRQKLLKHLQRVRTQGLAVEDGEHVARRRCMAAPVRGAGRFVVAAVGLALPDGNDCLERLVACHAPALREAARQLSGALQYVQPDWPEL